MTAKKNCWEFKFCRREPGGAKIDELGTCPAATDVRADGIHGGKCGGRACWALVGTLCGGTVQGTFASKLQSCLHCDFYQEVKHAEGKALLSPGAIHERLG
jgi:hypothetical protein